MTLRTWFLAVACLLAAAQLAAPSRAQAQSPAAKIDACAKQLSEDYTLERESQDLDGLVSQPQFAEFVQQCRKDPTIPLKADSDAMRCTARHLYWMREHDQTPQEAEVTRMTQACKAAARPISAALTAIPESARAHGSIFAHAATRRLFLALEPRGSSGAAPPVPEGPFQSDSDGSYAYTMISGLAQGATSMIVDLAMNKAILCHDFPKDGDRSRSENWTSNYYFDDRPIVERAGRCPASLWEFEPSILLNWREHLLKPAAGAVSAPSRQ